MNSEREHVLLSHEELKYREHFQRGNDFCKIELFRSAREEFRKALFYKPEDPSTGEKITACNQHIREDARRVYILVPIVIAIIIAVILFG
jgi:hypothetical protein